jgi:hypothetical protein
MRQLTSHTILYRIHEPPNRGSIDISTDETRMKLYAKKYERQDKKNNKTHCSRSTSREKIKRNDYNDYTNVKSIKTIRQRDEETSKTYNEENAYHEKRYRQRYRQRYTEIHRDTQRYTESIREDGMDITNDTWPFSLHQPPPHCTTRRIVVSSSLFLLVPIHPNFKPNLFPSYFYHIFYCRIFCSPSFCSRIFCSRIFCFASLSSLSFHRRNSTQVMGELLSKEATSTLRSYPDRTT